MRDLVEEWRAGDAALDDEEGHGHRVGTEDSVAEELVDLMDPEAAGGNEPWPVASDGFTVAGETALGGAVTVAAGERSRESSSADRTEKVMADGLGAVPKPLPSSVFRMPASSSERCHSDASGRTPLQVGELQDS